MTTLQMVNQALAAAGFSERLAEGVSPLRHFYFYRGSAEAWRWSQRRVFAPLTRSTVIMWVDICRQRRLDYLDQPSAALFDETQLRLGVD